MNELKMLGLIEKMAHEFNQLDPIGFEGADEALDRFAQYIITKNSDNENSISIKYKNDPSRCPFCESESIESEDTEFEHSSCYFKTTCKDCKRAWIETFYMSHIEECQNG